MQVRQALVASPGSRVLKQNELISRSEGIGDQLVQTLCQWSPGRNGFALGVQQSINFFQPDQDTFALSRSVVGLECERDGGRRIISQIVLFDRDQLSGYNNNIALVAHVLRTSGRMVLRESAGDNLPLLDVPESAFESLGEFARAGFSSESQRIVHALELHDRVVILGLKNPLPFLCSFLATIEAADRLAISFATGLKVLDERRFSIQFFPESHPGSIDELAGRQLRTISLASNPLAMLA